MSNILQEINYFLDVLYFITVYDRLLFILSLTYQCLALQCYSANCADEHTLGICSRNQTTLSHLQRLNMALKKPRSL